MNIDIETLETQASIFKALGHPIRLCISQELLSGNEKNVSEMQNCLQIPQSTLSQHLSILRTAGIIQSRRNGTEVYYSMNNEIIIELLTCFTKNIE